MEPSSVSEKLSPTLLAGICCGCCVTDAVCWALGDGESITVVAVAYAGVMPTAAAGDAPALRSAGIRALTTVVASGDAIVVGNAIAYATGRIAAATATADVAEAEVFCAAVSE